MSKAFVERIKSKLYHAGYKNIVVSFENGATVLNGELSSYEDIVKCGRIAVSKRSRGVINKIRLIGHTPKPMRIPSFTDEKYEGKTPDVLIIGGGIVGCAIARELSKYQLDIMLVEKESDLAMAQSSRNDGEIHPGIDLKLSSVKAKYNRLGNKMYTKLSSELGIKFERCGQTVLYTSRKQKALYPLLKLKGIFGRIPLKNLSKEKVSKIAPNVGFNHGDFLVHRQE